MPRNARQIDSFLALRGTALFGDTFFVGTIGYIVYAGLANKISSLVWYAIGLVVLEGIVLLLNKGSCPSTPWAARFTDAREDNFDIFLPRWLARHNKVIFTTIFGFGVMVVIFRVLP